MGKTLLRRLVRRQHLAVKSNPSNHCRYGHLAPLKQNQLWLFGYRQGQRRNHFYLLSLRHHPSCHFLDGKLGIDEKLVLQKLV